MNIFSWLFRHAMDRVTRRLSPMQQAIEESNNGLTELWAMTERWLEAEEARERASALVAGINRVLRETLICDSDEQIGKVCLAVAEELTGSKFGFIGLINEQGLFDDIAISNPGWDECKMPESDATKLIMGMTLDGIDRGTMADEKSRIVNDPASHPDRKGTPDGHPEITRFLGVPLKYKDKTIGMIGLGNKREDYVPADQDAIEQLSAAFTEVLMRERQGTTDHHAEEDVNP